LRTSESKGHWKPYDSGAVFEFEIPGRTRREMIGISNSPHQKGYVVRPTVVIVIAALLTPAALAAHPLASGLTRAPAVADISAAKKKKKPAKVKEEYLKAAPGTGPSGPTK
jgi:hypothetical protein